MYQRKFFQATTITTPTPTTILAARPTPTAIPASTSTPTPTPIETQAFKAKRNL
jgi:hypothetical protein